MPRSYRLALSLAMVLGFQVALVAAVDVQAALDYDQPATLTNEIAVPEIKLTPLGHRQLQLAIASGERGGLEAMLPWRTASSLLLAIASGFVLVLGVRLWLSEESRPVAAQHLGTAALVASLLRAIDGGQNLVIMRSTMAEFGKALVHEGVTHAVELADFSTFFACALSVARSALILAGFVWIGNYFRSDDLRTALARAEP